MKALDPDVPVSIEHEPDALSPTQWHQSPRN